MRTKEKLEASAAMLNKQRKRARMKDTLSLSAMALPGVLLLLIFNYIPMIGVIIAFQDYNPNLGIFESPFVGFKNFEFYFTSSDFTRTMGNTLFYSISFLFLNLVTAVGLALMFYSVRNRRLMKAYNTVIILPRFLSAVIISFIAYILLAPTHGIINQLIVALGGDRINWYMEPKYWPIILTIVHIWQVVGMNSIIYYASLMSLDDSLIEAAVLDGANKWQQIRHVLIPHLVPVMVISTILALGGIFGGDFGLFYQTPKNVGALYETTDIINTYVFRALQGGKFEMSTAVNLFQSVAGLIMVVGTNAVVRKVSPENSLF